MNSLKKKIKPQSKKEAKKNRLEETFFILFFWTSVKSRQRRALKSFIPKTEYSVRNNFILYRINLSPTEYSKKSIKYSNLMAKLAVFYYIFGIIMF